MLLLLYALTVPADAGVLTSGMAMSAEAPHKDAITLPQTSIPGGA
jgi:hypothetical protein